MRRIGVALAVWIVAVLLLWLGGGLGLRPSVVLSLVIALILDQVISVQQFLSEPKRGVFHLGFDADLASILLDLGVIDSSTDLGAIEALQEAPYAAFPHFSAICVWIPEVNLLVWPSIQVYQSKLELNVTIRLPLGCPLGESIHREHLSHGWEEDDGFPLWEERRRRWEESLPFLEQRDREVKFFIEDGYPEYKFGLWVPKVFAEERIKAGGFGSACEEYKEEELYGQFKLIVGRFPADLFRPLFPKYEPFRQFVRHLHALREFDKILKDRFEKLGWTLEDHEEKEYLPRDVEIAKHKYMEIEIYNRER